MNNFERQVVTLANFGVDCLLDCSVPGGVPAGDNVLNFVVPKGKVVTGIIYRNMKDDLEGGSVSVKLDSQAIGSAVAASSIKGTSAVEILATPVVVEKDSAITVNCSAAMTDGHLDVILLYV